MKLSSYSDLVKEWHPTLNGDLKPSKVSYGSNKKVWWLCSNGHSYDASVKHRTNTNHPTGCPYCSSKKIDNSNSLSSLFSLIAEEWHPTKNKELTPDKVSYGSGKKVWWLCPNGHSYDSFIYSRTSKEGIGCPYCSGHKATKGKNLSITHPKIAKEWHPNLNGDLKPNKVSYGSNKKVWWLCTKKRHSFKQRIEKRTLRGDNCPYCSGQKTGDDNNLEVMFPEIAKEWHPTKNGKLTPRDVTPGSSHHKVWWLCPKGHNYDSIPKSRTGKKKHGCPYCTRSTSVPEIRIFSELKWLFDDVNSRFKIDTTEIDIFLSKFNLAIEYDGWYYHKDRKEKDLEKNIFLSTQKIHFFRVREQPLELLSKKDLNVSQDSISKSDLNEVLKRIYPFVDNEHKKKINDYFDIPAFVNEDLFKKYVSYFPSPFPEKAILKTHPLISAEWDYVKNYPLTPENFSSGNHFKAGWLCSKGHSYEARIYSRTGQNKTGCPYCSGNKVSNENSLQSRFPEIAEEWHPTKNGNQTPELITYGSTKKVWWLCSKGHTYDQRVYSRTGKTKHGCPYCAGRKTLNFDLFK
jgi:hypothetical protein